MSLSTHRGIDKYGHKYSNTVWAFEDDIVVFGCEPPLEFDIKAHGLKIVNKEHKEYDVDYEIKGGMLYLTGLSFESPPIFKPAELFGSTPLKPYPNLRRYFYTFEPHPVDYTGVWQIGKDFDFRFWPGDEKAKPTPFCPEVYKQNGFIRFENGRIVEIELHPRKDQ
ncbi:MAG: hypothetical protein IJD70_07820 [Clostridia bacterium]|nr:hypothetical protein [Clostridia bacterium]